MGRSGSGRAHARPVLRRRPVSRVAPPQHRRRLRRSGGLQRDGGGASRNRGVRRLLRLGRVDDPALRLCGRQPAVHPLPAVHRRDAASGPETLRHPGRQAVGTFVVLGAVPDRDRLSASSRRPDGVRRARRDRPCPLRGPGPRLVRQPLRRCAGGRGPAEAVRGPVGRCLAALRRRLWRQDEPLRPRARRAFRVPVRTAVGRHSRVGPGVAALGFPASAHAPAEPDSRRLRETQRLRRDDPARTRGRCGNRLRFRRQRLLSPPPV